MPKRVLFARPADALNLNAQAKNVQNILRHWNAADVRASVISFYAPDPELQAKPGVEVIHLRPDRLWRHRLFFTYMRNFDAVFCPGSHHYADWAALKVRALTGRPLPVIATMEGLISPEDDQSWDRRYSEIAGHPVYSQKIPRAHWRRIEEMRLMARKIIAISPFLARIAKALYAADVETIALGVNSAFLRSVKSPRRGSLRVVCAANVSSHKSPDVFLQMARRFPDAEFAWYGEGEMRPAMLRKIEREKLVNVSFPGALQPTQLAEEFARSDIMLLPSRNEGVPKVTQEAAAAGLAQVVYGFYETPSVVDGVNGFVVWSVDEMADRLARLLTDQDLIARMGEAGAETAKAWSWESIAPQWQSAITDAIAH